MGWPWTGGREVGDGKRKGMKWNRKKIRARERQNEEKRKKNESK